MTKDPTLLSRRLNIRETEPLDEAQFTARVKQASALPGPGM